MVGSGKQAYGCTLKSTAAFRHASKQNKPHTVYNNVCKYMCIYIKTIYKNSIWKTAEAHIWKKSGWDTAKNHSQWSSESSDYFCYTHL